MNFRLLTEGLVFQIHEFVINPHELQGLAKDKSLGGALSRVEIALHMALFVMPSIWRPYTQWQSRKPMHLTTQTNEQPIKR